MEIAYYLDGVNLKNYGVYVSESSGLISRPKLKEPVKQSWKTHHGDVIDLSKRYYESRKISLDCFIKATSKEDFVTKLNTFLQLFDAANTRRLMVVVDVNKPLVYEVYLSGQIDPKKTWRDTEMVGTFSLELTEPAPIKKVIRHTREDEATKTLSVTITTSKVVDIFWGDGAVTYDVYGTAQTVTHDYSTNGTYYAIVAGCIDEITSLTTTGTVLWNKL